MRGHGDHTGDRAVAVGDAAERRRLELLRGVNPFTD
jgi:hypothetical protein